MSFLANYLYTISVKSISKSNSNFTMTNNEYSAADQFSKNYFICLIKQIDKNLVAIYIQDPVNTLNLEKRVKQWEWYVMNLVGKVCI